MEIKIKGLEIAALASVVPKTTLDMNSMVGNFEAAEIQRIIAATGVQAVRRTTIEQTAADLCFHAAERLFSELSHTRDSIDGLVFVSSTPDYICNATGPILQDRLGLKKSIASFDINYGCSGYVYGLLQAAMMVSTGVSKKVLLLVGETPSKIVDVKDRATQFLFGDAGSATIVSQGQGEWSFHVGTDGSGYQHIFVDGLGFRNAGGNKNLQMHGAEVMSFVTQVAPDGLESLCREAGIVTADVERWYFHQANKMIVDYLQKKLKIEPAKVARVLSQFGNTGGASIPLTISDFQGRGLGKAQEKSVLAGFGVGLSWAFVSLELKQDNILEWSEV